MRLGARENAEGGILLAATTEHFLYYPASQVRLFVLLKHIIFVYYSCYTVMVAVTCDFFGDGF